MDKAISQLIDTLNGQVSTLPRLAKEVLHQWIVSHYVLAAIWLLVGVGLAMVAFAVIKKGFVTYTENVVKWQHRGYDNFGKPSIWDMPGFAFAGGLVTAATVLAMAAAGDSLYSALNPIVTLISSFTDK
ncbi:hypothetical protein ACFQ44_05885 [Levilactobacillus lanxiensis]|uniref:Uncharacterized protein n=1 Tax=Levilactobacillus lanxiensis TaxID=2799568 RepID=A0ABW4D0Y0_9LACO|nr:hypothetical protein [Levilactobacillus lanxiensis]